MYQVELVNDGGVFAGFLRGTCWVADPALADRFPSRKAAQAALLVAQKFVAPAHRASLRVVSALRVVEAI